MTSIWQDPTRPAHERVSALLAELTLREKVAQLGSAWIGFSLDADTSQDHVEHADAQVSPFQDAYEETPWEVAREHGLGHITRPFGTQPISPADGVKRLAQMQRDLMDTTRLGIPAIAHEECLTGFTTFAATIYPTPLALAATFDPVVVEGVAARIGADLRSVGVHQGLSPVLDVVRDYRWGRVEETMGEDPYLVSVVGTAYVRGLEGAGIIATLKHFVGYSASRAGRNHAPVSMGSRELRDIMLPPFEAAIREGGARSVMNSYTDIDGVPVVADESLLTGVLREGIGFTGVTVSDYWAISLLANVHHVAETDAEAGALALLAGMDVELPATRCYSDGLLELVSSGRLAEEVIDRSVTRVLHQKLELGLLDADYDPLAGVDPHADLDSAANQEVARRSAEQSVVLLSNSSTLPLPSTASIALIGPCATESRSFLGCYSYPNHVLHRFPELGLGVSAPTLQESLTAEFPSATLAHARGCAITGSDTSGIAEAVALAKNADVAIVAVGDLAGLFGLGTSGEGCDAADLTLPGAQAELINAVIATGTPTVVVCVSGRPYSMGDFAGKAAAIVQAFMPGQGAGAAIAGVLSGRVNPSGHLPVQIPAVPYAQPATYLQAAYGLPGLAASSIASTICFPFGHGLSYTSFEISDFTISSDVVSTDGALTATATITNTGDREGADAVQLYYSDPVAEVARPVLMLLGFARVELQPGHSATVSFDISTDRFAYCGRDGARIVEAGAVELAIGYSSQELAGRQLLRVDGPTRLVGFDRTLTTPVNTSLLGPLAAHA